MRNKLKIIFGILYFAFAGISSAADNIAQCSNPSGKGYFPYLGMVSKSNAGWDDEKITGGLVTLTKIKSGEYDVRFVDSSKRIISAREDGGKVFMIFKGDREVSVLVVYTQVVEAYNFYVDNSGKAEYTNIISRAGDGEMISKASVMRGDCQFVNLNLVN